MLLAFKQQSCSFFGFTSCSILRHALDKIAEIKSLLEERRIGGWACVCTKHILVKFIICSRRSARAFDIKFTYVVSLQLLRWQAFTATATLPERRWGAVSWWHSSNSRPWRFLCGSESQGRGSCCFSTLTGEEEFSSQLVDIQLPVDLVHWAVYLFTHSVPVHYYYLTYTVYYSKFLLLALHLCVERLQPAATTWPSRATRWQRG